MRILITGAAGFVGTHLVRELCDRGHDVAPRDRMDFDLALPDQIPLMVDEVEPDYVVHLAARYGRLLCRDEPHRAVADNTASTAELAAVCAERGIPVLYASSSEVYGDHGTETITEKSELCVPTTIYGLSKRWGEEALNLYMPLGRKPESLCIVRMNMLYGPEQLGGYGRCSLATFIQNAVEGKPFTVHQGTTRSWLYISDAVRALRLLIEGGHTGIFNLGNPARALPMVKVGQMVCDEIPEAGMRTEWPPVSARPISHKNYSVLKLLNTIDWMPEIELREGIRRTVEWARENAKELRVAA